MNWYFLAGINIMESVFLYKHKYRYMSTCTYTYLIINRDNYNSFCILLEFVMIRNMRISKPASATLIFASQTLQCNA